MAGRRSSGNLAWPQDLCVSIWFANRSIRLASFLGLFVNARSISQSGGSILRLTDKQARGLILGNRAGKGRACLLACLLAYCLYIVNLVVAVVSNRPLVFLELMK